MNTDKGIDIVYRSRNQWSKELGKDYRLRNDAVPRGISPATGAKLYLREDFCLASDQVQKPAPTPEEIERITRRRKANAAKRRRREINREINADILLAKLKDPTLS